MDKIAPTKTKGGGVVAAGGAALAALLTIGFQIYNQYIGTHSVIVASAPSEAEIRVNDTSAGKTPLTLELKRGTYTLEARRAGYETSQHAIYVSEKETNIVNIVLIPKQVSSQQSAAAPPPESAASTVNSTLSAEIEKLKQAIITKPEEALSLPLLREKQRIQEELSKALRDDLKELKEQNKWYLATMIAITVGLLAVIGTLFVSQRSKSS